MKDITSKKHNKDLGYDLPDDYFEKSKNEILSKIAKENSRNKKVISINRFVKYSIAASIVLAIGIMWSISFFGSEADYPKMELANLEIKDYDFVNSLFIDDAQVESFIDTYLNQKIVTQGADNEIMLYDYLMDALLLDEDSLDDFADQAIYRDILF